VDVLVRNELPQYQTHRWPDARRHKRRRRAGVGQAWYDAGSLTRWAALTLRSAGSSQLGVDLSEVAEWVRFLEIHYDREGGSGGEVTVVMVPSVAALATLMPSPENWPVRDARAFTGMYASGLSVFRAVF
jgi:hypothetical protein